MSSSQDNNQSAEGGSPQDSIPSITVGAFRRGMFTARQSMGAQSEGTQKTTLSDTESEDSDTGGVKLYPDSPGQGLGQSVPMALRQPEPYRQVQPQQHGQHEIIRQPELYHQAQVQAQHQSQAQHQPNPPVNCSVRIDGLSHNVTITDVLSGLTSTSKIWSISLHMEVSRTGRTSTRFARVIFWDCAGAAAALRRGFITTTTTGDGQGGHPSPDEQFWWPHQPSDKSRVLVMAGPVDKVDPNKIRPWIVNNPDFHNGNKPLVIDDILVGGPLANGQQQFEWRFASVQDAERVIALCWRTPYMMDPENQFVLSFGKDPCEPDTLLLKAAPSQ